MLVLMAIAQSSSNSAQDGGFDAMYIKNQKPLQRVEGEASNNLIVKLASDGKFNAAHENWEQTGGKALLVWHKGELVYEIYGLFLCTSLYWGSLPRQWRRMD